MVKMNNLDHKVIVLGCQQDFQSNNTSSNELSNPVTFTFQFDNLISDVFNYILVAQ